MADERRPIPTGPMIDVTVEWLASQLVAYDSLFAAYAAALGLVVQLHEQLRMGSRASALALIDERRAEIERDLAQLDTLQAAAARVHDELKARLVEARIDAFQASSAAKH